VRANGKYGDFYRFSGALRSQKSPLGTLWGGEGRGEGRAGTSGWKGDPAGTPLLVAGPLPGLARGRSVNIVGNRVFTFVIVAEDARGGARDVHGGTPGPPVRCLRDIRRDGEDPVGNRSVPWPTLRARTAASRRQGLVQTRGVARHLSISPTPGTEEGLNHK